MALGERIVSVAKEKGLSQKALSLAVGVAQSSVSGWASGGKVDGDNLLKAAKVLGVTVEYLAYGEGADPALNDRESELLRLFRGMSVKEQTELLCKAYSFEAESYQIAARGGAGILQVTDKVGKAAIDNLFDSVDRKKDNE